MGGGGRGRPTGIQADKLYNADSNSHSSIVTKKRGVL